MEAMTINILHVYARPGMGINKRGFWVSELYEANEEWFEKDDEEEQV